MLKCRSDFPFDFVSLLSINSFCRRFASFNFKSSILISNGYGVKILEKETSLRQEEEKQTADKLTLGNDIGQETKQRRCC